jgi:glutamate dehydrogenase
MPSAWRSTTCPAVQVFRANPHLCLQPLFRRAIQNHLPRLLSESPRYQRRIKTLPAKYISAILAAEIASSLVYRGDREADFAEMVKGHLLRHFPQAA